jgi:AraC-like DNA-binding protein
MPETPTPPQHLNLSSRDFTGRDRADALRELFGRAMMRVDLWPCEGAAPLDFSVDLVLLGGGAAYATSEHTPAHIAHRPAHLGDGGDDLFLTTTQAGCVLRTEGGHVAVPAGGFLLHSKARAHEIIHPQGGRTATLQLSHTARMRRMPGLEEAPLRLLPPGMAEPALAMGYAQVLANAPALSAPLLQSAQSHLHELMAGILAPTGQGAQRDALDVPRLALIQRDILAHLAQPGLNLAQIAQSHHLTPRQVQRLFAREGTCFSDFVRDARLDRVRAALANPRQRHQRVLQIVLDNGFDDFSAFSRAFRRRFGMTPTEAREADPPF